MRTKTTLMTTTKMRKYIVNLMQRIDYELDVEVYAENDAEAEKQFPLRHRGALWRLRVRRPTRLRWYPRGRCTRF